MLVRRRLGELGLAFDVITVPRPRSQRQEVLAVSGQPTVPVLVTDDGVFSDENDILAYLDRTYGQESRHAGDGPELWPAELAPRLDQLAATLAAASEELLAIARGASRRQEVDLGHVLQVAGQAASDAARWTAGQAEAARS